MYIKNICCSFSRKLQSPVMQISLLSSNTPDNDSKGKLSCD